MINGQLDEAALSDLLAEKLAERFLDLSDVERKSFAKRILANNGRYTHRHWKPGDHRHIKLELTPGDLERLEAKADKFAERIPDLIEKVTDKTSVTMLAALRSSTRARRRCYRDLLLAKIVE